MGSQAAKPEKGNQNWRTPLHVLVAIERSWPGFVDGFPPSASCSRWREAAEVEDPKRRAAAFKAAAKACYEAPCSPSCGWAPPRGERPVFRQGPWCAASQAWRAHARDCTHAPGILTLQPDSGTPAFAQALRASSFAVAFGRIAFVDPTPAGRTTPPAYPVWLLSTARPLTTWAGPGAAFEVSSALRPIEPSLVEQIAGAL